MTTALIIPVPFVVKIPPVRLDIYALKRFKMKKMNDSLRISVRDQMKKPLLFCEMYQTYCRFAIPGYCLVEYSRWDCPKPVLPKKEKK